MTKSIRHYLSRVYLNADGYDSSGAYFGIDLPLWKHEAPDGTTQYLRGRSRLIVKQEIRKTYPDARFWR